MNCNQTIKGAKCSEPAMFRFTWPGSDESVICEKCVHKLIGVAKAMGMYLQVRPISELDKEPQ